MIVSMIWLPAALLAGLFQAWRTAVQQRLRSMISISGAGLVRYLYGVPVGIVLLTLYMSYHHASLPETNTMFFVDASIGGIAQILATLLLIAAFGYGNFVVGTAQRASGRDKVLFGGVRAEARARRNAIACVRLGRRE